MDIRRVVGKQKPVKMEQFESVIFFQNTLQDQTRTKPKQLESWS